MIKKTYLFLICLFVFMLVENSSLFSQTSYWMQRAGGATPDEGSDISIDANGNTYTTGYFTSYATFGTTTLIASGITDIFITKVDNTGKFKWAIKAGGPGSDRGLSIKADTAGNTYVTGFYYGTATFGSQTITSSGVQDLFIAKYNNAGILQWVKSAGGIESDIGNGINVDNSGNVVVTGEFKGAAIFGSFSLASMNNSIDVFTAKLDANGNFLWAKKGSAIFTDKGIDLACDASGNVYVTGQFTDTITFDVMHLSTLYNATFLIKYNAAGKEQWFKTIGGGTSNIASGIAVDVNENIYLTGDFTGNLIFFGSPNTTLTNTYSNKIFIAKYDNGGNLLWTHADGSSNYFTSKNITLDASDNVYTVGNFKCRLNEYADKYGQGVFNSIGYWDIFVSKYNSGGTWQWSRQCGGGLDDYGAGIAVNNAGDIHITGSFNRNIIFPQPSNFTKYNADSVFATKGYCGDAMYGTYDQYYTAGSSDILIAKNFDPTREPYDYYIRKDTGCSRPYHGVCISSCNPPPLICTGCVDSVEYCKEAFLYVNPSVYSNMISFLSPDFNYLWSNGSNSNTIYVNNSGDYWVQQTSADGCFVSMDTIHATIHPLPATPTISDNKGINTNEIITKKIILCGDSVLLTAGNYGSNIYKWSGPTGTKNSITDWATVSGYYSFIVTDKFGCENSNTVQVVIDKLLSIIDPKMICLEDGDGDDTISLCIGQKFHMYIYDFISNPSVNLTCIPDATILWTVTPNTVSYGTSTPSCMPFTDNLFTISIPGTYQIDAKIIRKNNCDTDTMYVTKTIFVKLFPDPIILITGSQFICPGDSTLLVASGADTYRWDPPVWSTNDSLWVKSPNTYTVYGTNSFGCTGKAYYYLGPPPQPIVTMNPSNGMICPNDSVQLSCNGTGTFVWQGPLGPIGGNTSTIYVNTPGFYYCIRTDGACELVSNTVIINQYAKPYLLTSPTTILCPGDSTTISVITNVDSKIQWQAPLTGSSTTQVVKTGGTYTCLITSCGIQTLASVTIIMSNVNAQITPGGALVFCDGDSVLLYSNGGMINYIWQPGSVSQSVFPVYKSGTYTLTTIDNYGCSASAVPVTVNVTPNNISEPVIPDTSICPGESVTLIASGTGEMQWYKSFDKGIPFYIGSVYITPNLMTTTSYYLVAADSGCKSKRTLVTVTIEDCDKIIIPTVFTPNGDGVNDVFYFSIVNAKCFECKIYNRWGIPVYELTSPYDGWDGIIEHTGQMASDGVYYFILNYCSYNDTKKSLKGFVQLIR